MSSLIEGIGDEVLVVFGMLFLVLILSLAWISTHVGDIPPINIIVLDRRRWNLLLQRLRNTSATIIRIPVAQHIRQRLSPQAVPPDIPDEQSELPPETSTVTQATDAQEPQNIDQDVSVPQSGNSEPTDTTPKTDTLLPGPSQVRDDNQPLPDNSEEVRASKETKEQPAETDDQPTEEEWQERSSEGFIRVRVKYLDDRQRLLYAKPDTTIGQLKRSVLKLCSSETLF